MLFRSHSLARFGVCFAALAFSVSVGAEAEAGEASFGASAKAKASVQLGSKAKAQPKSVAKSKAKVGARAKLSAKSGAHAASRAKGEVKKTDRPRRATAQPNAEGATKANAVGRVEAPGQDKERGEGRGQGLALGHDKQLGKGRGKGLALGHSERPSAARPVPKCVAKREKRREQLEAKEKGSKGKLEAKEQKELEQLREFHTRRQKLEKKWQKQDETRNDRRKASHKAIPNSHLQEAADPNVRKEYEQHARRKARLEQARDVAEAEGRTDLVARLDKMMASESKRHAGWENKKQGAAR